MFIEAWLTCSKMSLEAIRFNSDQGTLEILNQLLLPERSEYESISTVHQAWAAIKEMKVRAHECLAH